MKKVADRVKRERDATVEFITALWVLAKKHKKMTFLIIFFHLWVYGLAFHHLEDFEILVKKVLSIVGLAG